MSEEVPGGTAVQEAAQAWAHLDGAPPDSVASTAQAYIDGIDAQRDKPAAMNPERYAELKGPERQGWQTISDVASPNLNDPNFVDEEPSSAKINRLTLFADAVRQGTEAQMGFGAIPQELDTPAGRQQLARQVDGFTAMLLNTDADTLAELAGYGEKSVSGPYTPGGTEAAPAAGSSAESAEPTAEPYAHMAGATAQDAAELVEAGMAVRTAREAQHPEIPAHATRTRQSPDDLIHRRLLAAANRNEDLATAMKDLAEFAGRLQNPSAQQGVFADAAFRAQVIKIVRDLDAGFQGLQSPAALRELTARTLQQIAQQNGRPAPAAPPAEGAPTEARPAAQPQPAEYPPAEQPPLPESQPKPAPEQRTTAEQERRARLVEQALNFSHAVGGSGVYSDLLVPGRHGLSQMFCETNLMNELPDTLVSKKNGSSQIWNKLVGNNPNIKGYDRTPGANNDNIYAEGVAFTPAIAVTSVSGRQELNITPKTATMPDGTTEPVVTISYDFHPISRGPDTSDYLKTLGVDYASSVGGRPGGRFAYTIEVPASLANDIKADLARGDVSVLHDIGEGLIQRNAPPEHKARWNEVKARERQALRDGQPTSFLHNVYPPNRLLPEQIPLHVFDATVDAAGQPQANTRSDRTLPPHQHSVVRRKPELILAA